MYPIQSLLGGYPIQSWPEVRGYAIKLWQGDYPIPGPGWYPIQSWPGVGYPIQSLLGVPHPGFVGGTHPGFVEGFPGYPPSRPGMGYPPSAGWGTPPYSDLGQGTPPPPPPPMVNRQTFPRINITFPRTTYATGKNYFLALPFILHPGFCRWCDFFLHPCVYLFEDMSLSSLKIGLFC